MGWWWWRFLLTLVLGPALWWIGAGYVATQQGSSFPEWLQAIPDVLPDVYLYYTLPALLLCVILFGIDRLLQLASLDILTVIVSPLVAYALAWAAVHYIHEPHVQAAGSALPLFVCYGLVWGLTIREPRRRREGDHSDGAFVKALLP